MRPNNFDLIRLLAALQVVYCHTCWHLDITTGIGNSTLSHPVQWFPGVPIFFVISGFLISRSWERSDDWKDYARKRALRIYPALWVQLAAGILLAAAFGAITPTVATSRSFFLWVLAQSSCIQFYNPAFMRSFGLGVLNGSLWTIPVELGFYLSLPILYAGFVNRVGRRWADGGLALLALASFTYWFELSTVADPESTWTKLQMVSPLPHLHMFLVGVLLQRNFERVLPLLENRAWIWFPVYAAFMLLFNPWGQATLSSSAIAVLAGRLLLAASILSVAFSWRSFSERLLKGHDISYGVYLYHGLAINVLVQLNWKENPWLLALVTGVTVVLAMLSWQLIERPAVSMKPTPKPRPSDTPPAKTAAEMLPVTVSSEQIRRAA